MAVAQVSTTLFISARDARVFSSSQCPATDRLPQPSIASSGASFSIGTPLVIQRYHRRGFACKARPVSVRSEQSTQQGKSLDVWLGRLAMVGFAVAITVEISTGKGLLENFGLISPLPTAALAVTALVGVLTAVFIFQSASKN